MTGSPPRSFAVRFRDLERWSVNSFSTIDWHWPAGLIRPLCDALSRKYIEVEKETINPQSLKLATLHFNGEMEPRQQRGNKPIKGRLWWADPGDVIYSKIDVRHGAIGIVPDQLGRICVTSEFPVYAVDSTSFDAQYIKLLFRTNAFRRKINSMISGTSGRKRVQPADLASVKVPLPPLTVQKSIVSAWEQAKSEIADIQGRITALEEQIEVDFLAALGLRKPRQVELPKVFSVNWSSFDRWSIEYIKRKSSTTSAERCKYPLYFLGDLCDGQSGSTPSKRNKSFWNGGIPWVSPKDMKNDIINDTIDHITDEAIAVGTAPLIPPNSVLVVVRSGILQHTVPIAMNTAEISINQDMRALTPKADVPVIGGFIAVFLKCSQHKLLTQVKWSTTVQSINRESIQDIEIPLPPLKIQKQLVQKVTAQRKVVSQLRAEAQMKTKQAKADIEAMIIGNKPVPDAN